MHLLQPSTNIQLSRKSPDAFLKHALRVVSRGYGFPSIFNADTVVEEQLRQGKTPRRRAGRRLQRLRGGGRVRQGSLHPDRLFQPGEGAGTHAAQRPGPAHRQTTGPAHRRSRTRSRASRIFSPRSARSSAISSTSRSAGSRLIERMYADHMPAPFLSVLIDDCIAEGAGLQRRRRPLQQHLHPDGRPGQHHRLPQRPEAVLL